MLDVPAAAKAIIATLNTDSAMVYHTASIHRATLQALADGSLVAVPRGDLERLTRIADITEELLADADALRAALATKEPTSEA